MQTAPQLGAIGLQPYESRNIRLSAALCCFGFHVRHASQPATVVVDFETKQAQISFWHEMMLENGNPIHAKLPTLTASMLGLWWSDPKKYSVEGYNDALGAIRHVFEAREWLIKVIKGAVRFDGDGRKIAGSVTTESLHVASIIKANGIPLITFHKRTFVFGRAAGLIAAMLADESCPPSNACIDWQLAALKYRDWLHQIVKQKECVPLIEKRDGERVLRIRADMPKTLRREFIRRF